MRIVIVRSNPVDPDSRVEKEANSLYKAGHSVVLLTWDRESNHRNISDVKELSDCVVKRIRIGAKARFGAGYKSLFPFIRFQSKMFWWLVINHKSFDACHLCDFDTAFIGSIAAKLFRKKVVFDVFDYLSTNPKSLFRKIIKKLENRIINNSDATIICTEQRKVQIQGTHPKRLVIIHNTPDRIDLGKIEMKSNSNLPKIVYVGVLDERQRMLKELVQSVAENSNVELHVGGFGILEDFMIEAQNKYSNVFFYGRIPYQDTLALESQCDIITAIYNPVIGNSRFAAPNKFYEALMFGKPLIMIKGTGMSDVVETEGIGVLVDCSLDGLRFGIHELLSKKSEWKDKQDIMKNLYSNSYSWKIMEKRLWELYEQI